MADGNEEHTDNDNVAVDQDTKRITSIPSKSAAMHEARTFFLAFARSIMHGIIRFRLKAEQYKELNFMAGAKKKLQ